MARFKDLRAELGVPSDGQVLPADGPRWFGVHPPVSKAHRHRRSPLAASISKTIQQSVPSNLGLKISLAQDAKVTK